ncbi:MAG: ABC transporter ATP-binding protein [Proteobacteria bacterium]|nr:ABC transporter ATP-binding protein [Pseudomonadota bacterium]MBU1696995.1 ABC transporter ATP-binding protein [Pseudomonadota bacterium]
MNQILFIDNLSFKYHEKSVLKDISFSTDPGEFISIIGPNGCGKTTLIKIISKINKPEKGNIYIKGKNIQTMSNKQLARHIAVVMQSPEPVSMSVEEYVLLGRLPFFKKYQFFETAKDIALAHKYMELTGILKLAHAPINEISGGERQLAAIARALTQEPMLLILDEPTSHLDITHQIQILELISCLKKTLSISVLMVIHDLNLAAEYSDRLVLLNGKNGTIYQTGTCEQVLSEKSIREVYNARVLIQKNPVSKKPCVFLVTQNALNKKENPIL